MELAVETITEAAVSGCLTGEAIRCLERDFPFEGERTTDVQRDILWVLEHDGYLVRTPAGYEFVSRLLRAWWHGRYRAFFTPVLKRGV